LSNKLFFLLFLFLISGIAFGSETEKPVDVDRIESGEDTPARVIYVKLNGVEGAQTYELQIRPAKKVWMTPFQLRTSRDYIRFRVTPGYYAIRTRALDGNDKSKWSSWREFWVPFRDPLKVFPAANEHITPKSDMPERLSFEWPKVLQAKAYRIKLYDQKGELLQNVVTEKNWFSVTLDVRKDYSWSLKPISSLSEPEDTTQEIRNKFSILEPRKDLVPVSLKLSPKVKAEKYQFELVQLIDNDVSGEPTIFEKIEPVFDARLAPSRYELRVRSLYSDGSYSSWSKPNPLFVPFPEAKTVSPIKSVEYESTDDIQSKVVLKWEKVTNADRYQVVIQDESGSTIDSVVTSETKTVVSLPHETKYKWKVFPLLKSEQNRNPASVSLSKSSTPPEEFRVNTYQKISLSDSEEPSQLYAWGRTILANTSYKISNWDNGTKMQQNMFVTTGELALGYWHRKTNFGALASGSTSGINIAGVKSFYSSGSLMAGYRTIYEGSKRLRFWLGLGYRELPEVQLHFLGEKPQIRKIASYGPQTLVSFFDSLNEKWGYQLYLGGYFGAKQVRSPNGLSQSGNYSVMTSAYATYRFNPNTLGLLGYTYQLDKAGYKSADRSGNENSFSLSGHYLSLSLIWGLQEPQK